MDKLELKDIAPYLQYNLQMQYEPTREIGVLESILHANNEYDELRFGISTMFQSDHYWLFKPILRPMSDLTKEITHNGETFIPLHRILEAYCFDLDKMDEEYILSFKESLIEVDMSYKTAQMLHEMHFDTEKLIERDLAINLNEVDNGK
ncbi:hypothetical protein HZP13_14575 [Elizabethkingia anophelis]|nr:hypothetical protein [Elizabethkingia anophelis]